MKYLIILIPAIFLSCSGEKKRLDREMDTLLRKGNCSNLKYRNYTTTQVKYLMEGKKDSAQLYEDSAKVHYIEYFRHMKDYDSLQLLFNKK